MKVVSAIVNICWRYTNESREKAKSYVSSDIGHDTNIVLKMDPFKTSKICRDSY